jgi:hypothetical protein
MYRIHLRSNRFHYPLASSSDAPSLATVLYWQRSFEHLGRAGANEQKPTVSLPVSLVKKLDSAKSFLTFDSFTGFLPLDWLFLGSELPWIARLSNRRLIYYLPERQRKALPTKTYGFDCIWGFQTVGFCANAPASPPWHLLHLPMTCALSLPRMTHRC